MYSPHRDIAGARNNFLAKYGEVVSIGWDGDSDWKKKDFEGYAEYMCEEICEATGSLLFLICSCWNGSDFD